MIRSICDKNWMKIEPKPGKTESHFLLILNSKCNNILLLISHLFIWNYVMLLHTKSCNKLCHSCRHSTRRVLSQFLWHLIVCHNINNKKELGGFSWVVEEFICGGTWTTWLSPPLVLLPTQHPFYSPVTRLLSSSCTRTILSTWWLCLTFRFATSHHLLFRITIHHPQFTIRFGNLL